MSVRCQNESERIKEILIKISDDFYETIHQSKKTLLHQEVAKQKYIAQLADKYYELRHKFDNYFSNERNPITFTELVKFFSNHPNNQYSKDSSSIGQLLIWQE